jgi:hypothetical protein
METVMAELKLANTIAKERVADLAQRNGEPSWLQDSRNAAWEIYFQSPMPTTRDDDWRKTEIDNLDLSTFITVDPLKEQSSESSSNGDLAVGPSKAERTRWPVRRRLRKPNSICHHQT